MTQSQLALPGMLESDSASVEWVWSDGEDEMGDRDSFVHASVMSLEIIAALEPASGIFVDATLGAGGHTEAILEASPNVRVIAFDRDTDAIEAATQRLERFEDRVTFVHANFSELTTELHSLGISSIRGLCADLGVSSPQLDRAERGMSFRREGPLDMRMDRSSGETALELIARLSDDELADVIFRFGEERRSRRIARSVKRALAEGHLETTLDLRRAVVRAVGPVRVGGVDPATRTFQALRIAVNDELSALTNLLEQLPGVLEAGGRVALLSFHSLEDRLVKHALHRSSDFKPLYKRPLTASDEERAVNLRSRSAKLRAATRIDDGGSER